MPGEPCERSSRRTRTGKKKLTPLVSMGGGIKGYGGTYTEKYTGTTKVVGTSSGIPNIIIIDAISRLANS